MIDKKRKKPEEPSPPSPEDEEEEEEKQEGIRASIMKHISAKSFISIGDIQVGHNGSLKDASAQAIELLKNKEIRSYLKIDKRKKALEELSTYIN